MLVPVNESMVVAVPDGALEVGVKEASEASSPFVPDGALVDNSGTPDAEREDEPGGIEPCTDPEGKDCVDESVKDPEGIVDRADSDPDAADAVPVTGTPD